MSSEALSWTIERHYGPEEQAANPYPLLPFDLPEGIARLEVSYRYSDPVSPSPLETQAGNVVDVGVFDPDGFRGWSGSARTTFTLAAEAATPGYLPGPLKPGRWHVLLGLYKMAPHGCDVQVQIDARPGEPPAAAPAPWPAAWPESDRPARPGWYRGDLHCHSHHSEATGTLHDLLAAARARGLDFLAITEHNTVSHLAEMAAWPEPPEPLVIPAMEITTYGGHANALGIDRWHDFRCHTAAQMAALRAEVQAAGALFVVNHPKVAGPPWEWGDEGAADAIEVWQHPWVVFNYQSLALWDALLKQGRRVPAVGGSDKHQGPFDGAAGWHELGTPTTWVQAADRAVPALLAGLRAGHVFISAGPAGPRLELTADSAAGSRATMGDVVSLPAGETATVRCRVTGAAGQMLRLVSATRIEWVEIDADPLEHKWSATAGDGYWRAEVQEPPPAHQRDEPAAHRLNALSNPIYLANGPSL